MQEKNNDGKYKAKTVQINLKTSNPKTITGVGYTFVRFT